MLLQKTLLYVEGWGASSIPSWICGRPPSPIWKTGCISRSAPRRCGMPSGKAPFWAEKLPELPELVYETLRQARHQQHHFDQMFADFRRHSRRQGRPATS